MASTRGRQVVVLLTNKSGGSVAAGDVVILDTGNDTAFTTTTTGRAEVPIGVAQETIANNATGRVLVNGYAALVNVPASVTRGHYVETHTVAKQATGNSSRRSGSFGQFLTGGTTPTALIWGDADPAGGAGGAPTTATYLTTTPDATLSAEVVIPGLGGSPDIRVAGTNDDEFDTTDTSDPMTGWTTLGTPTTHSMNSQALSHYYVKQNATASTSWVGIYKANPSMPFTVTAKLADSIQRGNYNAAALFVGEATPGKLLCLERAYNTAEGAIEWELFTNPTTFSTAYVAIPSAKAVGPVYLRIIATSSTNIAAYYSYGGLSWHTVETGRNPGFTVGSVGLAIKSENATYAQEAFFDWIRFS